MLLARRKAGLTMGLLTIALIGLLLVQAYLLHGAVKLKETIFRNSALSALGSVARRLEADEAIDRVNRCLIPADADSSSAPPLRVAREIIIGVADDGEEHISHRNLLPSGSRLMIRTGPEGATTACSLATMVDSTRRDLVERVLVDMIGLDREPITRRFDLARIDEAVRASLAEGGIDLAFAFGLRRIGSDSLVAVSEARYAEELAASDLQASLFPLELLQPLHELAVYFPRAGTYLWAQIWPLLLLSLLFTSIIVFGFVQSIRTIIAQHRFADQIVGFVNNMTHEFKTPLSTVGLASEALLRPDVKADPEASERYVRMITEENRRMRTQVERILQVAQFERGDFALDLETIDIHDVIEQTLLTFALRIQQRGGILRKDLAATCSRVRGDPIHLAAIAGNLIDNAIKYSPGHPEIDVHTRDDGRWVQITIRDRGWGIREEDQGRVFEKYFRCDTGARHDIKGFGLGLSYVRTLVVKHGGRVDLESRVGEGTRVTVRLPLE